MRRFAAACDAVGATTQKTAKVALISELLKVLSLEDAARAAIFLTGRPFAHRDERVLGVGGSQLAKIVAQISGADLSDLGKSYRAHGDLGDMAAKTPCWWKRSTTASAPRCTRAPLEFSRARSINASFASLPGEMILDGEILAWHGARHSGTVASRSSTPRKSPSPDPQVNYVGHPT